MNVTSMRSVHSRRNFSGVPINRQESVRRKYSECRPQYCISLKQINEHLEFKSRMVIRYHCEDGCYVANYHIGDLVIASAEDTVDELLKDLKSQFSHVWEYYTSEDDSDLTESARAVKKWMLENVRGAR
ncbi:hypothetical protein [Mobilibacterium timonense]|jgi:hypothetical protein|uniref:hypothetical protein n=1 Tax=Mobilibacterium timonense TaxID=1871012 RepID=UPI0009877B39|nr:hypothetical protein [Mobilibacterium timonense]MBM6989825.1 hypothetical protein [Mobilibacterium timonense]